MKDGRDIEEKYRKLINASAEQFYKRVTQAVETVAKARGCGMVLGLHFTQKSGEFSKQLLQQRVTYDAVVYYGDKSLDITDDVIKELNKNGVGGNGGGNGGGK